jgi:hypothetical protein
MAAALAPRAPTEVATGRECPPSSSHDHGEPRAAVLHLVAAGGARAKIPAAPFTDVACFDAGASGGDEEEGRMEGGRRRRALGFAPSVARRGRREGSVFMIP